MLDIVADKDNEPKAGKKPLMELLNPFNNADKGGPKELLPIVANVIPVMEKVNWNSNIAKEAEAVPATAAATAATTMVMTGNNTVAYDHKNAA
ncbi:MAG: hypothetical protein WDW21_06365 [Neisseriaceae bacterium]